MATLVLRDSGSLSSPGATAKGSPLTNLEVDNNFSNLNISIGVNSNLTTSNTANLVIAINELNSKIAVVNANVGLATSLTTGNTTNVVAAINELNSNKGATAGTYGGSSNVAVVTVNAKGFVTSIANVAIAGVTAFSNAAPAGFTITTSDGSTYRANANISGVTASTYGGSTSTPVIVVDAFGRITSASNVTSGVSISNDTSSTTTTFYPLLSSVTTGTLSAANVSSSKLLYQPSTGNLTASIFTVTGSDVPSNGIYLPTTSTLGISTGGTERIRVDSAGYTGIGTSSPTARLDVSESAAANVARFTRTTAVTNSGVVSARFKSTSNSDMTDGFGTAVFFSIQDNAGVQNDVGSIGVYRAGADNSAALGIGTASAGSISDRIYITSGGLVGIATTSPTSNLHVVGNILCTNTVTAVDFNSTSDESTKDHIVSITNGTSVVKQLDGVEFTWKNNGSKSAGFIAQRIEEVLPHLVHLNSEGTKTLNYNGIIAYLVQAVKELEHRIQILENR